LQQAYIRREAFEIQLDQRQWGHERDPIARKREGMQQMIGHVTEEIAGLERMLVRRENNKEEEERFAALERRQRELQHELGRIQGRIEAEQERISVPKTRMVDTRYIQESVEKIIAKIHSLLGNAEDITAMRKEIADLLWHLETLQGEIERGSIAEDRSDEEFHELRRLQHVLTSLQKELECVLA